MKNESAVEVRNLTKRYGGGESAVTALDDVSLSVNEGEAIGLLGPNGAGKTTLIKLILGIVLPTDGTVRVAGEDVSERSRHHYRTLSAMLEGARNVYWRLTVRENMAFFASLQGLDPREYRDEHNQVIDLFGLEEKADDPVKDLSRGMKQKAKLACALARRPQILFLDEPTLGLDVRSALNLRAELRRLVETENRTVVLCSHDMDVIQYVCDRIVILQEGEICVDRSVSELVDLFDTQAFRMVVDGTFSDRGRERLDRVFNASDWERNKSTIIFNVVLDDASLFELIDLLQEEDVCLTSISSIDPDLEQVFLELTKGGDERLDGPRIRTRGSQ